jgi:hypothetical protein
LFRLCRYVRTEILKDEVKPRMPFPLPKRKIYQQGNLILHEIPSDAVLVAGERLPDGSIPLGEGHFIRPVEN